MVLVILVKQKLLRCYLKKNNVTDYIVFARDENEWDSSKFSTLSNFSKVNMEHLNGKTAILDDAGAYKELKTKVEDYYRYCKHVISK